MKKVAFKNIRELGEYVAALVCVGKADNDFSDVERLFIEGVVTLYGAELPCVNAKKIIAEAIGRHLEDIGSVFKHEPVKSRMLIRDLIILGHVDGKYTDDERCVVHKLAESLNIPQDEFERLQMAVIQQAEAEAVIDQIINAAESLEV